MKKKSFTVDPTELLKTTSLQIKVASAVSDSDTREETEKKTSLAATGSDTDSIRFEPYSASGFGYSPWRLNK